MATIGSIALVLALIASVYSTIASLLVARGKYPGLAESVRKGVIAVFGLVSVSVVALLTALVAHDFQIEYVASYTSRDLSLPYLVTALWAGNDGSLLFWAWLLSIFAAVAILQKRSMGKELVPYASSIILLTEAFFLSLLLTVANPFHKLSIIPTVGLGLNPMLENIGMILHPPSLLAGYVAFTIPFAFAIAALLTRRFGDDWIMVTRRWLLLAWLLLGMGNIIGAWWAYVELGWGGYWAWDPVENAGMMPWLLATTLLHSTMMQMRRGKLKVWNIVLVILTFNLTIFGTFLTRSGVLSSVHSYAESGLGPLFLAFLGIAFLGPLGLVLSRRRELKSGGEVESLVSRENTFLLNNILLAGAAAAILVGTVFPVISEMIAGTKIGVGRPFFNQVTGPIFLAIILLTGICTLIGWRRSSTNELVQRFLWPMIAALILGIALFISGIREWYALVAFPVCGFTLATVLFELLRETRARHRLRAENYLKAFWGLIATSRPRYGSYIAHIALVFIAVGVVGSSLYGVERSATLSPGESMMVNGYTLTYENIDVYQADSKLVVTTPLTVYNEARLLTRLTPEKYYHRSYQYPVTEVAIHSTLAEDLYVIPVDWSEDGTATFKVLVNPLVIWIWIGGGVLVLGGLISFWHGRQMPSQTVDEGG